MGGEGQEWTETQSPVVQDQGVIGVLADGERKREEKYLEKY